MDTASEHPTGPQNTAKGGTGSREEGQGQHYPGCQTLGSRVGGVVSRLGCKRVGSTECHSMDEHSELKSRAC